MCSLANYLYCLILNCLVFFVSKSLKVKKYESMKINIILLYIKIYFITLVTCLLILLEIFYNTFPYTKILMFNSNYPEFEQFSIINR